MFIIGGDDEEDDSEDDSEGDSEIEDENHDVGQKKKKKEEVKKDCKSDEFIESSSKGQTLTPETPEQTQLRDERQSTRTRTTSSERERALQIHRFNGLQKGENMFLSSQNLPNTTLFLVDKIKTHTDVNG